MQEFTARGTCEKFFSKWARFSACFLTQCEIFFSFTASGQFYRGSDRRVPFPVKILIMILKHVHATGKLGPGPHIFDRVNDRAEKRPRMRGPGEH